MGALMPVGGGPDKEIIDTLKKLFNSSGLATLRRHLHDTGENLFDKDHTLKRVAARIGAYPARDYPQDPDAKKKWFYFLRHDIRNPAPAGRRNSEDAIKRILSDSLTNQNITAVEFAVEENHAATRPHLYPSNDEPLANYLDSTQQVYLVHLIVPGPIPDQNQADPPGDTEHDKNAQGTDLEKPIEWPTLKRSRRMFGKGKGGS